MTIKNKGMRMDLGWMDTCQKRKLQDMVKKKKKKKGLVESLSGGHSIYRASINGTAVKLWRFKVSSSNDKICCNFFLIVSYAYVFNSIVKPKRKI